MTDLVPGEHRLSDAKRALLRLRLEGKAADAKTIPRTSRDRPPALSYAQRRLWFIQELEPESAQYNIPTPLRLRGSLDHAALAAALAEVVRRHEVLRTSFPARDGVPVQLIHGPRPIALPPVNLTGHPEPELAAQLLVAEDGARTFDLAAGPPLRARLAKLAEDDHVLALCLHHIAFDEWSADLLRREVSTLYEAFSRGARSPLPDLEIQYADYAAWQRERLSGRTLDRLLDHWLMCLADLRRLDLPADRPRPPVRNPVNAGTACFTIDARTCDDLRRIARAHGATMFMALLAAFNALLARYSGQDDFAVGTPVAGRTHPATEPIIGFFVNTLVIRARLEGDPGFNDLLARTRTACLEAFAHQELPFEQLVDRMAPIRDRSRHPLFDVIFNYADLTSRGERPPRPHELSVEPFPACDAIAKFDLRLDVTEHDDVISGVFEYSTDLYDQSTMERLARHFVRLVRQVSAAPDRPISRLSLLDEEESGLLVHGVNAGYAPPPWRPVHALISSQAARRPEATAVVAANGSITYRDLDRAANRLAHHLRAAGAGPDTVVAVCLDRTSDLPVAILGVLKAGAAYLIMEPDDPLQRQATQLAIAAVPLIVTTSAQLNSLPDGPALLVCLDVDPLDVYPATAPEPAGHPDQLAYAVFTSGSTGAPKCVGVTHRNLSAYITAVTERLQIEPGATHAIAYRLTFDFPNTILYGCLTTGGTLHLLPADCVNDPGGFGAYLRDHPIDYLKMLPTHLASLAGKGETVDALLPSRGLILGGEASPHDWSRSLATKVGAVHNHYGPSEATVGTTTHRVTASGPPSELATTPIGRPLASARVYVLDRSLCPAPAGVAGELFIGGVGVARGYLERPGLTADRFIPDPFTGDGTRLYRTGDLVRLRSDGALEFLGRADDQFKLRGHRIEPGEIEPALAACPGVAEAAVAIRRDRLTAYLVATTTDRDPPSTRILCERLRETLPDHMIPAAFLWLGSLPRTPGGKLDRNALPDPATPPRPDPVAPRSETERILAEIYQEVLGLASVGVDDDFFDLGGHSLLATQAVARARAALHVDLAVSTLFDNPTVAALARVIPALEVESRAPITRRPRDEPAVLSYAQQRLWFLNRLEPDSAEYTIPSAFRLRGQLDHGALAAALSRLIGRHEALRTTFPAPGGVPGQRIHPAGAGPTDLPVTDVTGADDPQAEAQRLLDQEARRPFDLENGPLLRPLLIRTGHEEHVLALTVHHIVSDGWSAGILRRELAALYTEEIGGGRADLPGLDVQYADYAAWQREWLSGRTLAGQLEYWRGRLTGLPAIDLPTDRPRPPVRNPPHAAWVSFTVGPTVTGRLQALARAHEATMFMTVLAAFQALLAEYATQDDIAVGTPVAGRAQPATEHLIGVFVNTLVIRTLLSGRPSFAELLRRVRTNCIDAYTHQDLPFERLVDELSPARDRGRHPVFDVLFAYDEAAADDGESLHLPGIKACRLPACPVAAKFDLDLAVSARDDELLGTFVYSTDLFDEETIRRLAGHFINLLGQVSEDPDRPVSDLDLLADDERRRLLLGFNPAPTAIPAEPVHEALARHAARQPGKIAVIAHDGELTYAELDRAASDLADRLRTLGVHRETPVGVHLHRGVRLPVASLGVLRAGGAYLPLDHANPPSRLSFMLRASGAPIVVTTSDLRGDLDLDGNDVAVVLLDDDPVHATPVGPPRGDTHPDQAAYVIFTSGSTGVPKGVVVSHRSLINRLTWMIEGGLLRAQDRVVHKTPIGFDVSIWELLGPVACGATLIVARPEGHRDPAYLTGLFAEHGVTVAHFVPAMLPAFVEAAGIERCSALDRIICSGESLTPDRLRDLRERHAASVHNLYGPTEAAIDVTWWPCTGDSATVPIGNATANTCLYVLGPRLRPVPIGVAGELFIGGVQLARGYLGRPDQTAERFVPSLFEAGGRLYRTGDLARWRSDGTIEFLGRADQQLKVRGQRVEPAEIEAALAEHPAVRMAAITTSPADGGLVGFMMADSPDALPDAGHLRAHLRTRLPDHMIPERFGWVRELPLTISGKLDRAALPTDDLPTAGADYVPPRTATERILAEAMAEVLHLDRVGAHDNFFEIGGDSIVSIRVISRVRDAGLWLRPSQIFEHQTIAELATVAGESALLAEQGALTGKLPLTPVQKWFFELDRHDSHHFNQAVAFTVAEGTRADALEAAGAAVVAQHDALRLAFSRQSGQIVQRYRDAEDSGRWFERIDVSGLDATAADARITEIATATQQSLDLERGPLLRMVWFTRGEGRSPYLLIVIHHLAVDAVSWGIIIEDLRLACRQMLRGERPDLGPKTTSYRQWATYLRDSAPATTDGAAYWLDSRRRRVKRLPVDHTARIGTDASRCTVSSSLDESETAGLLRQVPGAYHTQANDPLLAALALAITDWSGDDLLLVDVEGHGRHGPDGIDLSRTVGWFTTFYPLLLEVRERRDLDRLLKSVKEQLRQVPDHGLDHGRLRYLGDEQTASRLAALPPPEISFNYLGRRNVVLPPQGELLHPIPLKIGPARSPRDERTHALEIVCEIVEDRLHVEIGYSSRRHERGTMQAVLDTFLAGLRSIIALSGTESAGGYTPSDFPLAHLDQAVLDRVVDQAGGQPVRDIYPLSPMQQGMLHHSLLDPASGVYVQQRVHTLTGDLDPDVLVRALAFILDRYPALRAAVLWENLPQPLAVVPEEREVPLCRLDWRHRDADEQDRRLRAYLGEDRGTPMSFGGDPLLRVTLIRLDEASHHLVLTYHHLLMDGWSAPVVIGDMIAAYRALATGEPPNLPPRRPYRDYIAWLEVLDRTADETFWRGELAGASPTPLPAAFPGTRTGYGAHRVTLSEEISAGLTAFARAHHLTLATIVQGAWAVLLARYADRSDVIFGSTVSGREHPLPGIDQMIGLFINTVPVRARINGHQSIAEWLGHLQNHGLEARAHEHSPLADIQRWSGLPPGEPLFESLVVVENYPAPAEPGADPRDPRLLEACTTLVVEQDSHPLTVFVAPGRRILLGVAYDHARFDDNSVERLSRHMAHLLKQMIAVPDRPVRMLDPLDAAERARLVVVPEPTSRAGYDRLVHHIVADHARTAPGQIAVVSGDRQISYQELDIAADRLAQRILALGLARETPVGVCLSRGIDLVTAFLAILKSGTAYLPLDPTLPLARVRQMWTEADVSAVITTSELTDRVPGMPLILIDQAGEQVEPPDGAPPIRIHPDQLAYLFFTSGSTGTPKCVTVSHRALARLAGAQQDRFALSPSDRVLQFNAAGFDVSLSEVLSALTTGATLVVAPDEARTEPASLLGLMREQRITAAQIPPAMLNVLPDDPLPDLTMLLTGGEPAPAATVDRWASARRFLIAYGITEAGVTSTIGERAVGDTSAASIGTPISGTRLLVLGRQMSPVPAGGIGEIYIGGAGLARGYGSRPGLTAERFVPDPFRKDGSRLYRTGDRARRRPDGALEFLGRVDAQVKVRGHRIEPGEVEAVLTSFPDIRDAAVTVHRGSGGSPQVVAYLVGERGASDTAPVRDRLRSLMPAYMVPAVYLWLDALPVTPNGKLDRAALPPPADVARARKVPPRNQVEQLLADIFGQVLGEEPVGVYDDFFELGGHSLLATRVISRARAAFGKDLPITALFDRRTVADLAEALSDRAPQPVLEIMPAPRIGLLPLSFAQQRLWFLHQLESERNGYNVPIAFRLAGTLDHRALADALSEVVARHEVLRTRFPSAAGIGHQVIDPPGPLTLPVVDVSAEPDPAEATRRRVAEAAGSEFDLAVEPPLRALLVRETPKNHVLVLTLHHIGCDDWSARLVRDEIFTLYASFVAGDRSPLPPLPVQYADYAAWQRSHLTPEALDRHLDYWREQLAGLRTLDLPTDRPRPRVHDPSHAATLTFTVPSAVRAGLGRVSREHAATMFMITFAAYQALLSAHSGQDDFAVGTPISSRTDPATEDLIGFFVNTIVIRARLHGDPTFAELLDRVRGTCLAAYEHQDLPFERLVDALSPVRDRGRHPIFDVIFTYDAAPADGACGPPDLEVTEFPPCHVAAKFDLALGMREQAEGLTGVFEYSTDLFDRATTERLARHYISLLESLVEEPDLPLSRLDLLDTTERDRLRERDRAANHVSAAGLRPRAGYEPPQSEPEEHLTTIIAEVLGLDHVGVHDNFFELGGDSIVGIQVVARAREAGIRITAAQLFEHQTVSELAAAESPSTMAEQGILSGALPLTPIQHWFFERDRPDPHHFNQAQAFVVDPAVTPQIAQAAGAALLDQHDALRLRFRIAGAEIAQRIEDTERSEWFSRVEARGLSAEAERALITEAATRAQQGLDLARGPLMRMIWFDRGPQRRAYLAVFIHHLAVDAVSWGILVEDLGVALAQLVDGRTARLGAKTTSYRQWADRLLAEADAGETVSEAGYWLAPARVQVGALPVDRNGSDNREADACMLESCLDSDETEELLRSVPAVYHTQINDVLIAALARVITGWTGDSMMLVDIEGQGRTGLEDMDLSRTVGWFTAPFPALVGNLPDDAGELLKSVKEQLRKVPRSGLGHGLLRYLSTRKPGLQDRLAALPKAQISFNYLGTHDSRLEDRAGTLRPVSLDLGPLRSPEATRIHLLEMNCRVSNGRFVAHWTYSPHIHDIMTIQDLADGFIDALRDILAHCRLPGVGGYTPSDFPLAELDQGELDALEARLNEPIKDAYPLSPMQQGMLFHTLLGSAAPSVYVEQTVLRLSGSVDTGALRRALSHVANRHPVLRSAVVWENVRRPLAVVLDQVDIPVRHEDWSAIEEPERESRLAAWLSSDRAAGLPLDRVPLLRGAVIRLDDQSHYLVLTYHHLLLDGWSIPLLLEELFATARAFSVGHRPDLPARRPYRDHIAWLMKQDPGPARIHWQGELSGFRSLTPLPAAVPQPRQGYGHHRELMPEDVSSALASFVRREHLTLNTVIQGAWSILLSRYTAQDDVVFGTTVSGRSHALPGVDKMIGLFINTIPVRVRIPGHDSADTVASWLGRLQGRQLQSRPYEHTSLVDIHKWSDVPPGEPLFESIVVFENYPVQPTVADKEPANAEAGDFTACVSVAVEQDNYPLTLFSSPGDRIPIGLAYDHARYDDSTIRRLLHHLCRLLCQIAEDPDRPVRDLTLLGEKEHVRALEIAAPDRVHAAFRPVHRRIADQARLRPDAAAVTANDGAYTYSELMRRAGQIACRLRGFVTDFERPVGVCLPPGRDLPAAMVAVWQAGGVYLPLEPGLPRERLRRMLATAGAEAVISAAGVCDRLPADQVTVVCLADWVPEPGLDQELAPATHPDQSAYLIFTSGSTGEPKGITATHGSLANLAHAQQQIMRIGPGDRVLQLTSIGFDVSLSEMLSALTEGADLVISPPEPRRDSAALLEQLRTASITAAQIPVTMLDSLPEEELPALGLLLTGGEPVSAATVDRWSGTRRFLVAYGVTEATVTTTLGRVLPGEQPSIGRPIANIRLHVLDALLRPLPIGAVGEVFAGGAGVARGYAGRPDLTSDRFIPDPCAGDGSRLYRTGDLARFRPDGRLEFLGRADAQVKLRGVRIEIGEIETVLGSAPGVRAAAVALHDHQSRGSRLTAYLVADDTGQSRDVTALRNHVGLQLPEAMIPSHYVWLEKLPLTPNGKLDRAALPEPGFAERVDTTPPRTATERVLADIYAEVLMLDEVGVHDHFLLLGGHSLLATRAAARVRAVFEIALPIAAIFEHPTVADLAMAVEAMLVEKVQRMSDEEVRRRLGPAG